MPAFRPIFIYEDQFKGAIVTDFPDIGSAATGFTGHGEFVQVLREASGVSDSDTGSFLPRVEQDSCWMRGTGAEGHGGAAVMVVESLGCTPFVVGCACFTGGFFSTAL